MGWFTPKCPRCGGELKATGYCAPYPSHRCEACISKARQKQETDELKRRISELEKAATS